MSRHVITVDLGFGDSGKGTIVDSLVRQHGIKLVARTSGGCQAAHSVITPEGVHHVFSQFGSGTFGGALTLLMKNMMVDPLRLVQEGRVLESKGIKRALAGLDGLMHIDERCLVTTPYHAAVNQVKEAARGNQRHGSCGVGIGETAAYALSHADTLRMGDLLNPRIMYDKLVQMRLDLMDTWKRVRRDAMWNEAGDKLKDGWADAAYRFDAVKTPFDNPDYLDALCWRYTEFTKLVCILPTTEDLIINRDVVFEGAQGVLLDEDYGFHPYTTWSRVTSRNAVEALKVAGISDWTTVGVMRSYAHRHGAGPFPTENHMLELPETFNKTNAWQGDFRVGELDLPMLRYALKVQEAIGDGIDQLAVTHMDALPDAGTWDVTTSYDSPIEMLDPADFAGRETQTRRLMATVPTTCPAPTPFLAFVSDFLKVPIGITSNGPEHGNKAHLLAL